MKVLIKQINRKTGEYTGDEVTVIASSFYEASVMAKNLNSFYEGLRLYFQANNKAIDLLGYSYTFKRV